MHQLHYKDEILQVSCLKIQELQDPQESRSQCGQAEHEIVQVPPAVQPYPEMYKEQGASDGDKSNVCNSKEAHLNNPMVD